MLAAACGQYPNVHRRAQVQAELAGVASPTGGPAGGTEPGGTSDATPSPSPEPTGASGSDAGSPAGSAPTSGAPTSEPTNSVVPSEKGALGDEAAVGQNTGSSKIWGDTLVIGVHAPITGSAPVQFFSLEQEKALYWRYGSDLRPVRIAGRSLQVVLRDDRNDPSAAVDACRELATKDHAFLVIGISGPAQVAGCARFAQRAGVPYLSLGAAQRPLAGLGNYFALSETYAQQTPSLVTYLKRTYTRECGRMLMVTSRSASVDDAVRAFRKACRGAKVERVPASGAPETVGSRLCAGDARTHRVVYPLVDPRFFLQMARAARSCAPPFVGVGVTMGLDGVADAFCRHGGRTGELRSLSPAPAFADALRFDSGFERAAEAARVPPDDLGWLLWGMSRSVGALLEQTGSQLSRHAFIQTASTASVSVDGFGRLQFSPSNHFGGRAFSLLSTICSGGTGHYRTLRANVSGL